MKFSIIIVNYNLTQNIELLLESIYKYLTDIEFEIIIVDNCSPERDIEQIANKYSHIKFIFLKDNFGFGYANNRGMDLAEYDYYLLLNPDTLLKDDSLKKMMIEMQNNHSWGIVGPMICYTDGKIQESALHYPNIRYEIYDFFNLLSRIIRWSKRFRRKIYDDQEYETDFLFGSCLFIRKDINDRLGGFDEDYFLFSEEADYCFRAKNTINTKIIYFPKSKIFHEAGAITKKTPSKRIYLNYNSRLLFINKNYKYFYSLIFRYVVIVLFLKKIISLKISNKKNIIDYCNYYKKIIKIYFHNSPEFNER